jgi:hypothetical protein
MSADRAKENGSSSLRANVAVVNMAGSVVTVFIGVTRQLEALGQF